MKKKKKIIIMVLAIILIILIIALLAIFVINPYIKAVNNYNKAVSYVKEKNNELDKSIEKIEKIIDKSEKVIYEGVVTKAKEALKKAGAAKRIIGKKPITTERLIEETNKIEKNLDYSNELKELNDAYNAYEISIRQYKQMTNPTEEFVLQRLKTVDDIVDARAVTEDHDPNRKLHKPGGYTATVYFESKTVDQTKFSYLDKNDLIEKGTDAGGAVEVYETEELAIKRRDYLAAYDGSILSNGSHTVVGTCLIRTSDKLSASKQKELENKVIEALTKLD